MKNKNTDIIDCIKTQYNIDISGYDDDFIAKSLDKRMLITSCNSPSEYHDFLETNYEEGVNFYRSLFVSYSEFFRNSLTTAVLENMIIPSLLLRKTKMPDRTIRIWSVATAGGQEAYSLAIMLEEALEQYVSNIRYMIFATDIDKEIINTAAKGAFYENSLENCKVKYLDKYFDINNGMYIIKDALKKNIDFSVFNLLSENNSPPSSIFSDFDIIICANILIYYKEKYRNKIMKKLKNAMAENGLIISSESERNIFQSSGFDELYPQAAIFMKKSNKK